jgi:hypothetical protein
MRAWASRAWCRKGVGLMVVPANDREAPADLAGASLLVATLPSEGPR